MSIENKIPKVAGSASSLLVALAATSSLMHAQEDPEELDAFISEEIPIEESILPTSRPFNSVYGTERSILDTPRNVTIISREQLDAIAIKDIRDFSKLTSSSYTKTNFGSPSTPNLRSQEADLFLNGMRKGGSVNGNGLPVNFNSVESVNIVKGPAGVVYGTTNYLGGYADLITKKPFFDEARGSVGFSYGSYDQYTWNVDYSKPVSDKLAWRVSYEGKEWDGYWQFWKQNSQAIYFAVTAKPTEDFTIEAWAEYLQMDYTENWGINRVTQDLVDNGLYITNDQTDAEYLAYISLLGNGDGFWAGTPGVDYASRFGGAGFSTIVPADVDNPVPVDRKWKLAAPGDDSFGRMFNGGVDLIWNLQNGVEVLNKTYFSWKDRNTFSSYHYSELLRDNWAFDNRTEVRFDFEFGDSSSLDVNTGIRFRYDDIWEVHHFFNEPVNFWDMTRDPETRRILDQGFAGQFAYVPDEAPRGVLEEWYFGIGGDTKGYTVGPFAQFDYKINSKFSILTGFTKDFVDAQDLNPILGEDGEFDFNEDGDFDDDFEQGYKLEDTVALDNYNLSAVYKVSDTISTYATYNYSESYPAETAGRFDVGSFDTPQESELIEVGAKFSLMDGKLFIGTAYVDREYVVTNQDASRDTVFAEVFEIEFNYQPNKNFFGTFGYSHTDSERTTGFYASPYTIDRAGETGGIYISPTFESPSGLVDSAGVPEHLINGLFSYKWDNGFGITAGFLGWGEMNSGFGGYEITIPNLVDDTGDYVIQANTAVLDFQYEIDTSISYTRDNWAYKLSIYNITDEENWDANNSGYGNGSIVSRLPIRYELTAKFSF